MKHFKIDISKVPLSEKDELIKLLDNASIPLRSIKGETDCYDAIISEKDVNYLESRYKEKCTFTQLN